MTPFDRTDAAIAAAIFVVATWLGTTAVAEFRASGGATAFYQSELGPAVMAACGRGLQNPDVNDVPSIAEFLTGATTRFECRTLPAHLAARPLTPFQASSTYLQLAIAAVWKAVGVSWAATDFLSGIAFGLVCALTFAILRLGLSRPFAVPSAIASLLWPPNVTLAPQLRDYAKGPFLLAVVLLLGWLVLQSDRRRVFVWSLAAGAVAGIGIGFRMDLLVAVVPVIVTIAALSPRAVSAGRRIAAIGVFAAAVAVTAWPAVHGYLRGGNTGHVVLLGFADDFDHTLRVVPSVYQLLGPYNDTLAFSIVNGFAARTGHPAGADLSTPAYDRFASQYLKTLIATFPADVATRTVAALRAVPAYVLGSSLTPPPFVPSLARWLFRLRGSVSARLAPVALAAVLVVIALITGVHPRAAALSALVLVAFVGSAAIQFHERHFYYLQFVPWFAFALIAESLVRGVRVEHPMRAVAAAAAVALLLVVVVATARWVQQGAVDRLLSGYESAPRTELLLDVQRHATVSLLTIPEWSNPVSATSPRVISRFFAIDFDRGRCGGMPVPVTARYDAVYPDADLSETWIVPSDAPSPPRMFVVAYDRRDESIRFRGIEVPSDRTACIARMSRVDGLDEAPLLLHAALAPQWRGAPLYQRLQ